MINVIILAAGDISHRLPFVVAGNRSPALIPLNTKPLVFYLIEFYRICKGCNINLFISDIHFDAVKSELSLFRNECNIYALPETGGVNASLKLAMEMVPESRETIVNPVTTIPTKIPEANEVQISDEITHYKVCSNIIIKEDGVFFSPKKEKFKEPGHPFTGVFRVKSDELAKALERTEISDDLLYVILSLSHITSLKYKKTDWRDCGHEINYFDAKRKLVSGRSFNRITICPKRGILRKNSLDTGKLRQEVDYILALPTDVRVYFPRIITLFRQKEKESAFFEMEYYGYPNLAEYQLYWELNPAHWHRIFNHLRYILEEFGKYKAQIAPGIAVDMYLNKTKLRVNEYLDQLRSSGSDLSWFENETTVNGVSCKPLRELWHNIEEKIKSIYKKTDFCIMHGDFCFNNILYDMPSGVLRLVDPRGSFGSELAGIYGDRKYDLAKLAHSAVGGYDYFVNGLFEIKREGSCFYYSLNLRDNHELVETLCREMINNLNYDERDITFIMGLLFVSMCALHYESTERQQAMYIHGLKILNETLA